MSSNIYIAANEDERLFFASADPVDVVDFLTDLDDVAGWEVHVMDEEDDEEDDDSGLFMSATDFLSSQRKH